MLFRSIDASGVSDEFDALFPEGRPDDVIRFLVNAPENPNCVVKCMDIARENARQIRDVITTEMWEQLNGTYWALQEPSFWEQPPQEQLREIRRACQLFYGITDATLSRDLSWQFSRLGRLLEREIGRAHV